MGTFRKDAQFLCFDEPLTFDIGDCFPCNNAKWAFDEYTSIIGDNPKMFWEIYALIDPLQELDHVFTGAQERYLEILLKQAANVVLDVTHLHLHLPSITKSFPGVYVIHLHRRARRFVTLHLRPKWSKDGAMARRVIRWFRY